MSEQKDLVVEVLEYVVPLSYWTEVTRAEFEKAIALAKLQAEAVDVLRGIVTKVTFDLTSVLELLERIDEAQR